MRRTETEQWITAAQQGTSPYGYALSGTLDVASVVQQQQQQRAISDTIIDSGFVRWRVVNAEPRPRQVTLGVIVKERRIRKDKRDLDRVVSATNVAGVTVDDECELTFTVPPYVRQVSQVFSEVDRTVAFDVLSDGAERIETVVSRRPLVVATSKFDVVLSKGGGQMIPSVGGSSPASAESEAGSIVISYGHGDLGEKPHEQWHLRLVEHLGLLRLQDGIRVWSDEQLSVGDEWDQTIRKTFLSARVAILLVGPAFLASQYIRRGELPALLDAFSRRGVPILPVVVRGCEYNSAEFLYPCPDKGPNKFILGQIQAANNPSTPLWKLRPAERDDVYMAVVSKVRDVLKKRNPSTP